MVRVGDNIVDRAFETLKQSWIAPIVRRHSISVSYSYDAIEIVK